MASCQKLGNIFDFSNKFIQKLMLSKNINNKKCAPELILLNEKKNEEDSDNF